MHVAIAWDSKQLLLLTTALLPNRTTESFQMEAGPPYDKQRIQMGLRIGNTALIYFRSGVVHYQCVLIALASDLSNSKPLGCRNSWLLPIAVQPWKRNLDSHMEKCITCRDSYGVPKYLPHQKCRRAGSLFAYAQGEIEAVLWNSVY